MNEANTGQTLHISLLAWRSGDITMAELRRVILLQANKMATESIGQLEAIDSSDVSNDTIIRNRLKVEQQQRLSKITEGVIYDTADGRSYE